MAGQMQHPMHRKMQGMVGEPLPAALASRLVTP